MNYKAEFKIAMVVVTLWSIVKDSQNKEKDQMRHLTVSAPKTNALEKVLFDM